MDKRARSRSHWRLIALILVFAAPLALASVWYALSDYLPVPGGNPHGELIRPVRPLQRLALEAPNSRPLDGEFLRGKWTLVYAGDGDCDLYCEASLFKMRQVRIALGRDLERVQRLYLLTDAASSAPAVLGKRYPRMTVARPQTGSRNGTLAPFANASSGTFFLVDPLANVMMRYGPSTTSRGLKRDLERLLKASHIG